ncbi:unnamed protein product [Musa acuminata subsp. malaccensis]|uniref:(wild Malaysian banana) hypothetical protein n=1 Tax=Musa acuminata subsp. malaccensis TaxID=214687 RepID=A0A8D7F292_MUSAM|nr:unnamed protein product [Musa acuminata subsp. malaccensis]
MASQTPAVIQNENLPFHGGKGVNGVKADISKPARVGRQDRKALRDLSKTGKPALSCASKAPTLKDKSGLRAPEPTKVGSKNNYLTEDELKRCQEWAKEGIEQIHFSGNDSQKLQQEKDEERMYETALSVNKKVKKVLAALRDWTDMSYSFAIPSKEVASDSEDIIKMELVPEELPRSITRFTNLGEEEFDDLLTNQDFPFLDRTFELKLKEDYGSDISSF